jgi:bacillopeptidase F
MEDFETGLGDWGIWNGSWEIGLPTDGPAECFGGSNQCAGTVLDASTPNNHAMLISPAIVLPAIGAMDEIHLRYQEWFSLASSDENRVYVRVETSPGVWGSWSGILNTSYLSSGGVWSRAKVDLSAYAASKIQIGFQFTNIASGVGPGWFIDDVSVSIVTP